MKKILPGKILFGADYNPEQWPESVWEQDMQLMNDAGVNIVSLGIFSWASIQSGPGRFDFGWLDRAMDLLDRHGIKVNLATGTASPPAWLVHQHPEMLPTLENGTRQWQGARQHYSPSSAAYRSACAEFVRELANRYRAHPALVSWHVNNEYGCHVPADYGEESAAAFRVWLEERYGSLPSLNEAWGTAFWSQRYGSWEEILPPRSAPMFHNPCQALDFLRFSNDALLGCFLNEVRILREVTPDVPVNTNFLLWFRPLHHRKWAAHMDYVSLDSYPAMSEPPTVAALNSDLTRSCGNGAPWILMEQVTTHINWRQRNTTKPPGVMRLWSFQYLARGADGVLFFQWRQSRAGAEKFHAGLIGEGAPENQRCFRESKSLGAELARLGEIVGTHFTGQAAILHDQDTWWGLELPSKPNNDLRYDRVMGSFYTALHRRNIPTDFVFPDSDFASYPLLFVPTLYMVNSGLARKLADYVEAGGIAVFSYFSGIVDHQEQLHPGGVPGPLRELLGLAVEEWAIPEAGGFNELLTTGLPGFQAAYPADFWAEVVRAEGAEVLATFGQDYFCGSPALLRNRFGKGEAWYLATDSTPGFYDDLIGYLTEQKAIRPALEAPSGVEITERRGDQGRYIFVLNHNREAVQVSLGTLQGRDLLTDRDVFGRLDLAAYGVAVLRVSVDGRG